MNLPPGTPCGSASFPSSSASTCSAAPSPAQPPAPGPASTRKGRADGSWCSGMTFGPQSQPWLLSPSWTLQRSSSSAQRQIHVLRRSKLQGKPPDLSRGCSSSHPLCSSCAHSPRAAPVFITPEQLLCSQPQCCTGGTSFRLCTRYSHPGIPTVVPPNLLWASPFAHLSHIAKGEN